MTVLKRLTAVSTCKFVMTYSCITKYLVFLKKQMSSSNGYRCRNLRNHQAEARNKIRFDFFRWFFFFFWKANWNPASGIKVPICCRVDEFVINGPLSFIKHILHKTSHNMFLPISQPLTLRLQQPVQCPYLPSWAVNNSVFVAAKLIHPFQGLQQ